jgi:hypothetical protein
MMRAISLTLKETDQSYVSKGEVSLAHTINILNHKISTVYPNLKVNGTALRTLQRMGIKNLRDVGKWEFNNDGTVTIRPINLKFDRNWTLPARRNWAIVAKALHEHLKMDDLLNGHTELAIPKDTRKAQAERHIRDLVSVSGFHPSKATDGRTWASDG